MSFPAMNGTSKWSFCSFRFRFCCCRKTVNQIFVIFISRSFFHLYFELSSFITSQKHFNYVYALLISFKVRYRFIDFPFYGNHPAIINDRCMFAVPK